MYFHIGEKKIVSDKNLIGIFNIETLLRSEENSNYVLDIEKNSKSLIVLRNNKKIESRIRSFTLLKRNEIKDGILWRRNYDERI